MKHKTIIVGVLVLLVVVCVRLGNADVLAQTGGPYDLSWSSLDGGGQASTGGSYWVGGTAGQPDASAVLFGGAFELTGGFWSFQNGDPTAVTLASFTATPQGSGVLVQWETAIEIDNVGFNLYRTQLPLGNWVRLNGTLIPSQAPGSVFGATYTWLDEEVDAGITYYYRLEDVEIGGRRTFHGPISTQPSGPAAITVQGPGVEGVFGDSLPVVGVMVCLGGAALWKRMRHR